MLNATFQSGAYTRKVADIKAQTIVEIKFSGQDAGEIVAAYPQVSLNSAEVASGRITYSARLICTVVCSDGEGKLFRVQKGAEFSHYADDERLAPAQHGDCHLACERVQIKREGSNFSVAVVIGASMAIFENTAKNYLSDVDGAIVRREEGKLYNAITFNGESEIDDDFDCVASDVLAPCAKAVVTDCNVKTGLVEVSGEIYLNMLAVRDGQPVGLDRIAPFKCEISCEQAIISRRAIAKAEIKDMSVNCKVDDDSGKCSVDFAATLAISGAFYEEEQITFVADAFSTECELDIVKSCESGEIYNDLKVFSERVSGLCATKAKLDYTCAFLATALPAVDFTRADGGVEGSVSATLLYRQGKELKSTEINLPFSVRLAGLNVGGGRVDIAVSGVTVRQRAEGECEAEAVLKIVAEDGESQNLELVSEITEGKAREGSGSAISVYIPSAGDGLWETAKKLCCAPEEIKKTNPELCYPLNGNERIVVFRAKEGA